MRDPLYPYNTGQLPSQDNVWVENYAELPLDWTTLPELEPSSPRPRSEMADPFSPQGLESLDQKDGPLKQYEYMIRKLHDGLETRNLSNSLWPIKKDEMERLIQRSERLKSHILALICLDHFNLSETMLYKVYDIDCNIRLVSSLDYAYVLVMRELIVPKIAG